MKRVLVSITLFALTFWFVSSIAAQSSASIQIVKPADRRNVPDKNAQVTVEISGVSPSDGHYWELWVDEEPVVGARNGEQTLTVSFKPTGPHRLRAVLFDAHGRQLAASDSVLVMAAPVQEREPLFNRERMAPFMGIFAIAIIVLIVSSLWYSKRRRAQIYESTETNIT